MRLAIIPARGGSKRIPRKNIKPFCGKPMIARTLEAARKSGCFDEIIVSTDDAEIAEVALEYGAAVPFMRPANLADDYAATVPVIQHAIEWMATHGQEFQEVCCLYATAPFILPEDIARGLELLQANQCSYVFTVTSYPSPIQRALRMTKAGRVEMFYPEFYETRSQDLEEAWHDAGQFYWGKAAAWLTGKPVFSPDSVPLILPRSRVQDVDTNEDWDRAEQLFQLMQIRSERQTREEL